MGKMYFFTNTLLVIIVLYNLTQVTCETVFGVNILFNTTRDYLDSTYRYFVTKEFPTHYVDFNTAEKVCVNFGGHLTSIHNKEELTFLKGLIATKKTVTKIFVGLYVDKWTDGTAFNYKGWESDSDLTFVVKPMLASLKYQGFICKNSNHVEEGCHKRRKLHGSFIVTKNASMNRTLRKVTIQCNRPAVFFEVRYSNDALCVCGQQTQKDSQNTYICKNKLTKENVKLLLTVNNLMSNNDLCDFILHFNKNGNIDPLNLSIKLYLSRNSYIVSSSVVSTLQTSTIYSFGVTKTLSLVSSFSSVVTSLSSSYVVGTTSSSKIQTSSTFNFTTNTMPSFHISSTSTTVLPTSSLVLNSSVADKQPMMKATSTINPSPTSVLIVQSSSLSPETKKEMKFKQDLNFINELNTSSVNIEDQNEILRVLDAAANLIGSKRTNKSEQDSGMKAITVLENLGETLSRQLNLGNQSQVTFQQTTQEIVFGVAVVNTTTSSGFSFPGKQNNDIGQEWIEIPQSVFALSQEKSYFVGIIFNGAQKMKSETGNNFKLGSRVINAKLFPSPPASLKDPVIMTFEKLMNGSQEDCSFWIEDNSVSGEHGQWSTRECFQVSQNATHIRCGCSHFTNFAVLFKVNNDQLPEEDSFRLEIITYVGLSLSILGCLLTFLIYVLLRNIKSDRAVIHTNLVFALGVADIIFLLTVIIKPVKDNCLIVAMLAFYFYLSVFFWMFVEGVYIYLMVIKVFRGNVTRRRRIAYVIGWGCPIIIAVVTWVILKDDVISKYHCWLSVESGAIWAFVGPGLFIIMVNLIILIAAMRTTWATFVDDKEYGGLKSATKTFGAIIPILGITWVFGVMAFNQSSLVFQYIFAITNSIQGVVIFILYCLVNNEVRNELSRKYIIWQTRRDMSSSSAGRRPTYVVSSEKNTTYNRTTQPTTPSTTQRPFFEENNDPNTIVAKNYSFDHQVDDEGFELGNNLVKLDQKEGERMNEKFGDGYV